MTGKNYRWKCKLKRLVLFLALLFSSCAPLTDSIQGTIARAQFNSAKYADCRSNSEGIDRDPASYSGRTVCVVGLVAYKYKTRDPSSGSSLVIARFSYMQPGLVLISNAVDVFPSVGTCVSAWGKVVPYKSASFVNPAIYVYTGGDPNLATVKEVPQQVCE